MTKQRGYNALDTHPGRVYTVVDDEQPCGSSAAGIRVKMAAGVEGRLIWRNDMDTMRCIWVPAIPAKAPRRFP
jgi:hypothetical protein